MLLMRDDTSVRTLRVKGSTITFFVVFVLLLMIGGGLGIWGGLHYWKRYSLLSERQKQQERELTEARLQLERYVNYETLLVASNGGTPLAKNEEIGATPPPPRAQNATEPSLFLTQNATVPRPAVGASAKGDASGMPQANATIGLKPAATAQAAQPQSPPLISSDTSPLRINGFSGRIASPQKLRIRYKLSAIPSDEQKTISGTAKYFAAFANGTTVELPVQDVGDARFSISRMKPMEASLRISQGINVKEIGQINVSLELDDGKSYRETFPLNR